MRLDCSAKGLGWLWSVKSFVEETMLINARRVALHCVEFIADVAKGAPSAAGLLEQIKKVRAALPLLLLLRRLHTTALAHKHEKHQGF